MKATKYIMIFLMIFLVAAIAGCAKKDGGNVTQTQPNVTVPSGPSPVDEFKNLAGSVNKGLTEVEATPSDISEG